MSDGTSVQQPGPAARGRTRPRTARPAVIEAAGRLFAKGGYGATSIDEIAAAAGVSRAAVFSSIGTKAMLLKTAFDVALVGDDEPVSLAQRPRFRAVRQEPDPSRYLERYAEILTEIGGRLAPLNEAVRDAASGDPDARYLWETHRAERRERAAEVVRDLARTGGLREGLDREAAADVVWVLSDPGLYHQLVNQRAWAPERFQAWLADSLRGQLLAGPG
ncbi:MAG TPA: TetR family transcriptional regulator [Candidatus Eisenbacteria bacterium]|nr:TetR family transcriptional regulator [Candidatus Eisenbacteria bacterium]